VTRRVTFKRSVAQAMALFAVLGLFWALVGARLDQDHPLRTMVVVGCSVIGAGWLLLAVVVVVRLRRLRARRDAVSDT